MKNRRQKKDNSRQKTEDNGQKAIIYFLSITLFSFLFFLQNVSADEISARAAIVLDGKTEKILYAKNPHLRVPPASTTKLMTAMVVLDRLSLDSIITVSENAAETPSVTPHLNKGERYTVRDLLYMALMRSINSAAVALAEATAGSEEKFVELMNDKVRKMGLENTKFINASGLPGPDQYITAFDLAVIMKESLRYPTIREIISTKEKDIFSLEGRRLNIKNTNNLLWKDDTIVGGKTGYTKAAGHCFVCAEAKDNNLLISVVLGETMRNNLWESTSVLLSRGYDVLMERIEPSIYLSSVKERPVILASYKGTTKNIIKKTVSKKKSPLKIVKKKKSSKIIAKNNKKKSLTVYKRSLSRKEIKS